MEADLLLFDAVDVLLPVVCSANEVCYSPSDCLFLV